MISIPKFSWHSLEKLLRYFISDLVEAINNPMADMQTTVLVSAMLLIFITIIGLLMWLVISPIRGRKSSASEILIAKHFEVTRRETWVNRAVFAFAVFVTVNGVLLYGSQDSVCKRCHNGDLVNNVNKSTHREVACISCHSGPGIDGYAVRFFDYMRWVSKFSFSDNNKRYDAQVANGSCLRCHKNVVKEVVTEWGVKARHVDFLEAGGRCVDCHNAVAHGKALAIVKEPTMDKCLQCHNNKRVSASCDICHTSKASPTTRKKVGEIVRVEAEPMQNCRGCHPQTSESVCVKCHGIEMPHPPDWVRGPEGGPNKHALAGFINKKLCKRCHKFDESLPAPVHAIEPVYVKEIFCNRCHKYTSPHGSVDRWLKRHGPEALKQVDSDNPYCGECHSSNNERYCSKCHDRNLCSYCHSGGFKEKVE